jgi:hypothetical protein
LGIANFPPTGTANSPEKVFPPSREYLNAAVAAARFVPSAVSFTWTSNWSAGDEACAPVPEPVPVFVTEPSVPKTYWSFTLNEGGAPLVKVSVVSVSGTTKMPFAASSCSRDQVVPPSRLYTNFATPRSPAKVNFTVIATSGATAAVRVPVPAPVLVTAPGPP